MKKLDLHGIRHVNVSTLVENFVLLNEPPLRIITGNSNDMKQLVNNILRQHNFQSMTYNHNLGEIIVL